MDRLFLAADAGQPPSAAALTARAQALSAGAWADPLWRCHEARSSRLLLEAAADAVAGVCGDPNALVAFLPGLPIAIRAAVEDVGARRPGVLTTAVDRLLVQRLATEPPIPVDRSGRVNPADVEKALIRTGAGVFMCQVGNPEIGTRQQLQELHAVCRRTGSLLVVDASMAAGRVPLDFEWDVLVLDARSWAGFDGVTAVLRQPELGLWRQADDAGLPMLPLGAPGVADIVGSARALEHAVHELDLQLDRDLTLTSNLRVALESIPDLQIHGDPRDRLPHVVGFSALYVDAEALLLELDAGGIAVASGSACAGATGVLLPRRGSAESAEADTSPGTASHVLAAIGALTSGNVRVTLPLTPAAGIDLAPLTDTLPGLISDLRAEAGL